MKEDKYIAYIGTYTHGSSVGIHIFDLDVQNGTMQERKVVPVNNPSYVTLSHSGKFLYSIADEGVEAFRVLADGDLECVNTASIQGMRGCYLSTDIEDRFLFVAGYHDGKVTVMELKEDGSIGRLLEGIFHKGLGSVAERNFRPHINCATMTPDQKYLCVVDIGVDHVNIYKLDHGTGKLKLVDVLRCEMESAPRHLLFSGDGNFAYLICELKNYINVYRYDGAGKNPVFEKIQTIGTLNDSHAAGSAASAMKFTYDGNYLFCSNAGDNSVACFRVDKKTGVLQKKFVLPISGDYPKDVDTFPDGKHLMSLNHESNTITVFTVNYESGLLALKGKPLEIETPNCILIRKI